MNRFLELDDLTDLSVLSILDLYVLATSSFIPETVQNMADELLFLAAGPEDRVHPSLRGLTQDIRRYGINGGEDLCQLIADTSRDGIVLEVQTPAPNGSYGTYYTQFVAGDTYEEAFMTALQWEQELKEKIQ